MSDVIWMTIWLTAMIVFQILDYRRNSQRIKLLKEEILKQNKNLAALRGLDAKLRKTGEQMDECNKHLTKWQEELWEMKDKLEKAGL